MEHRADRNNRARGALYVKREAKGKEVRNRW